MRAGRLHRSINIDELDPEVDLDVCRDGPVDHAAERDAEELVRLRRHQLRQPVAARTDVMTPARARSSPAARAASAPAWSAAAARHGYDVAFTYRERRDAADAVVAARRAPSRPTRAARPISSTCATRRRSSASAIRCSTTFETVHVVVANAAITHAGWRSRRPTRTGAR